MLFEIPLVVEPTMEKSMSALENRFSSRADYVQSLVELKQTHVVCFLGPFDRAGPLSRTLTFNHHSIVKPRADISGTLHSFFQQRFQHCFRVGSLEQYHHMHESREHLGKCPLVVVTDLGNMFSWFRRGRDSLVDLLAHTDTLLLFQNPVENHSHWKMMDLLNVPHIKLMKPVSSHKIVYTLMESLAARKRVSTLTVDSEPVVHDQQQHRLKRVLVVEDNPINQKVVVRMLQRLGCEVMVAWDGEEAIECMMEEYWPLDLILMDIQMPKLDGLETTSIIRNSDRFPEEVRRVPIVALTAHVTTADSNLCIEMGMNDFLMKPVKMGALEHTLSQWAGGDGTRTASLQEPTVLSTPPPT